MQPQQDPGQKDVVTNTTLHGEVMNLFRRLLGTQALAILIFGALCAGIVLYAYKAVAEEARSQADAGVSEVRRAVEQTARENQETASRLDRHESQAGQTHLELRKQLEEVRAQQVETQGDIRALYRFQRYGTPQPRLETNPIDGGQ